MKKLYYENSSTALPNLHTLQTKFSHWVLYVPEDGTGGI